jgi:hypothetical protein
VINLTNIKKKKALRGSIAGELRKDLLGRDEGSHSLLGRAKASHQVLVKAQGLLRRKPVDFSEVGPHRQLRHCQGNPSPTADAAIDGDYDAMACGLEPVLLGARGNPQVIQKGIHHGAETLQLHGHL